MRYLSLRHHSKLILSLSMIAMLSGCAAIESQNDGKPLAKMTFSHIQPQPVYVASYEVIDESGQIKNPDKIQRGFVDNPARVINDYFKHRFAASGRSGKLRVSMSNISVTHVSEVPDTFMGDWFGVGTYDLYTIKAEIELQLWGGVNMNDKGANFMVTRDVRIPDYWSVADRQVKQMEALDHFIDDIDITVSKLLSEDFAILNAQ